jgi:hypothetical protein
MEPDVAAAGGNLGRPEIFGKRATDTRLSARQVEFGLGSLFVVGIGQFLGCPLRESLGLSQVGTGDLPLPFLLRLPLGTLGTFVDSLRNVGLDLTFRSDFCGHRNSSWW